MHDPELIALCQREYLPIVGLLLLHVRDEHVAEELAQEALLRLCQRWPTVRHHDRPGAWLSTVATNLARSSLRRRVAERRALARHDRNEVVIENPAVALAVREAVHRLPDRQRTAIAYRFYAGFSVAETAAAMRVAEGTVRALTHQGVTALRAAGLEVDDEEVTGAEPV